MKAVSRQGGEADWFYGPESKWRKEHSNVPKMGTMMVAN